MATEEQGGAEKSGLTPVLERNIETPVRRRKREEKTAAWQQRAADVITRFTGSMISPEKVLDKLEHRER
jgi:uncharacterized membrane protein